MTQQSDDQIEVEKWLAIRKEAGRKIDPETAEVVWCFQYTLDPYGIDPELPEEHRQVGREYFARAPGSDIWVWFNDLPDATADALWKKHKANLAFPAGLPSFEDDDDDTPVVFEDGKAIVVHISESIKRRAAKAAEQMAKLGEQIAKGL